MRQLASIIDLHQHHRGVTEPVCGAYAEALAVCLSRHHSPPRDFVTWVDDQVSTLRVNWHPPSTRVRDAWANEIDTTELAAYGVALAVVETEMGMVAISRARTLTGADYYVAPRAVVDYLENARKLEVSGVDEGPIGVLRTRLRAKVKQVTAFGSPANAIACVVGFACLTVLVRNT